MTAKKKTSPTRVSGKKLKLRKETLKDLEARKGAGEIKGGAIKSRAYAC